VSAVLHQQIRHELEQQLNAEQQQRLQQAAVQAEQRARQKLDLELQDLHNQLAEKAHIAEEAKQQQLSLRQQTRELEEQRKTLEARIEQTVEERLEQTLAQRLQERLAETQAHAAKELALLQDQLAGQRRKTEQAQQAELELRKAKVQLEERARDMDLEIQRRLDTETRKLEVQLRNNLHQEQDLKLKEKEKQIDDLRQALENARRRSELGSQELQGEVLELDIQAALEREFPHDRIEPVPKGMRGADIIQQVRDPRLNDCGAIVWETKNTKAWQPAWLDKLKSDQRAIGAPIAVLVTAVLPESVQGFGRIDGVWVSDLKNWPPLATALREQLIQISFARSASEGRHEKMELLYQYLAGDEFRQRVETIVEAFEAMQMQLQKERRAMQKHWAEREKQLQRVISSTTGMYGGLQGIIGNALPRVAALELDDDEPTEEA
jgi:hypothetical protein